MTDTTLERVSQALKEFADAPLKEGASRLLNALGYRSRRTADVGSVAAFLKHFSKGKDRELTKKQEALLKDWNKVEIVFQVSDSEIKDAQGDMFDNIEEFDEGRIKSFLFVAVDMKGKGEGHVWTRAQLADTTRAVNKLFLMPVMLLFRHGQTVTLAAIHHRAHKQETDRDVLEKVTLIKDIRMADPHRAHLDILRELALSELIESGVGNFDDLHKAWERILNIEALNDRFYREVQGWSERAANECKFPDDRNGEGSDQRHVIRMITRLLFIWFLKEKGLVPDELFDEDFANEELKKCDPDGSEYYKAVLQNLFFATLNTEIEKREFSKVSNTTHRDPNKFRYRKLLKTPDEFLERLKQVPFVNGGLFDCLDDFEGKKKKGRRLDVFTDNETQTRAIHVPTKLFFEKDKGLFTIFRRYKFTIEESTPIDQEVALDPELLGSVFENLLARYNPETRENARRSTGSYYTPRPVVEYMVSEALAEALFTKVEPADGEPDWLRERLLYLMDWKDAEASSDAETFFEDKDETKALVTAIADLKTLDPAVGSGAFPMGVLQTLTLALRRLDPNNKLWEEVQKEKAAKRAGESFETEDQGERDEALKTISSTFETYRQSDYGRKLYLIQNGIFGVDIQPIACQIAKLRFFISLIIEQEPDSSQPNLSIKPLPNLETHFVAGDTLIAPKAQADNLPIEDAVTTKRMLIETIREQYFLANTRQKKRGFRDAEQQLREELQETLKEEKQKWLEARERDIEAKAVAFSDKDAQKKVRQEEGLKLKAEIRKYEAAFNDALMISNWDPYDQNAHVDWFDPKHMLGVEHGFDVVIGNPPYIQLQKNGGEARNRYKHEGYQTFAGSGDIYQLFYERGCQLLQQDTGVLAYITSNSWMKAEYGKTLRDYFSQQYRPIRLLEMGKDVFKNAIVDPSVLLVRAGGESRPFPAIDKDSNKDAETFPPPIEQWHESRPNSDSPWLILPKSGWSALEKMRTIGAPLKEWEVQMYRGVTSGLSDAFLIDNPTRNQLISEDPQSESIINKVLRGRDIKRWQSEWKGEWLISTFPAMDLEIDDCPSVKEHLLGFGEERLEQSGKRLSNGEKARKKTRNKWFETQDATAYFNEFSKKKLIWMDITDQGRFSYDETGSFLTNTAFFLAGTSLKYLCAILNSSLVTWFMNNSALTSGMGTTRWIGASVSEIPIPDISKKEQQPFIKLVDKILSAKDSDPDTDISEHEAAIDQLVYSLYNLTPKEIRTIESASVLSSASEGIRK